MDMSNAKQSVKSRLGSIVTISTTDYGRINVTIEDGGDKDGMLAFDYTHKGEGRWAYASEIIAVVKY
jgi:hypothetical protein